MATPENPSGRSAEDRQLNHSVGHETPGSKLSESASRPDGVMGRLLYRWRVWRAGVAWRRALIKSTSLVLVGPGAVIAPTVVHEARAEPVQVDQDESGIYVRVKTTPEGSRPPPAQPSPVSDGISEADVLNQKELDALRASAGDPAPASHPRLRHGVRAIAGEYSQYRHRVQHGSQSRPRPEVRLSEMRLSIEVKNMGSKEVAILLNRVEGPKPGGLDIDVKVRRNPAENDSYTLLFGVTLRDLAGGVASAALWDLLKAGPGLLKRLIGRRLLKLT